jgi:hypothetical protein
LGSSHGDRPPSRAGGRGPVVPRPSSLGPSEGHSRRSLGGVMGGSDLPPEGEGGRSIGAIINLYLSLMLTRTLGI